MTTTNEQFFTEMLSLYNSMGEEAEQGLIHDEQPQDAVERKLESEGYSWEEFYSWAND